MAGLPLSTSLLLFWLYLLTGVLMLGVAGLYPRYAGAPAARMFLAFCLLSAAWSLNLALDLSLGADLAARIFLVQSRYLFTSFIAPMGLLLAMEYTGHRWRLGRRGISLLMVLPAFTALLSAAGDPIRWFRFNYQFGPGGPAQALVYQNGWWSVIYVVYLLSVNLAALAFLLRSLFQRRTLYVRYTVFVLLGSALPVAADALYQFKWLNWQGYSLTPVFLLATVAAYGWAMFRYRLFDLIPVPRGALIESLADGVVVLDVRGRIANLNPAARALLPPASDQLVGQSWETLPLGDPAAWQVLEAPDHPWGAPEFLRAPTRFQVECSLPAAAGRQFGLRAVPLADARRRFSGHLLILREITERKRAEQQLRELNQWLEQQVTRRTIELQQIITQMQTEIGERQRAEAALRATEAHLAERVADQSNKLAALYDVMLVAGQTLEPPVLLNQSIALIVNILHGQAGCLHLAAEPETPLVLAAQFGLTEAAQAQLAEFPAGWLYPANVPRVLPDLASAAEVPAALRVAGRRAYLGAPILRAERIIGVVSVYWDTPREVGVEDLALFSALAVQLALLLENVRLHERIETAAVLRERRRLARDLHDSVTQSLHSLVLTAEVGANRLRKGEAARAEAALAQLAETARQALKEMRLLLYEMRMAPLESMDLAEALQTRLEAVERRAGVEAQLTVEVRAPWPAVWDRELYPIAMEALGNSLKHSRATRVWVCLRGEAAWASLEVRDNGRGFDPEARTHGMGLLNMAERAERLGGRLEVVSQPLAGVWVRVVLGAAPADLPAALAEEGGYD